MVDCLENLKEKCALFCCALFIALLVGIVKSVGLFVILCIVFFLAVFCCCYAYYKKVKNHMIHRRIKNI